MALGIMEGRLEEIFVKFAPPSVDTKTLLVLLLQAIHILLGLAASTNISLIDAGADLVTQEAPSLVVTYNVAPRDAYKVVGAEGAIARSVTNVVITPAEISVQLVPLLIDFQTPVQPPYRIVSLVG
jgi:hypothetical protein